MPAIGIRPWTPKLITTAAWYDASDESTIIDTTDPGFAEQWNDKSGKGWNVDQGTLANKPATGVRTIAGKNVLDFDGSTDALVDTSTLARFRNISGGMIFTVIDVDDAAGNNQIVYDIRKNTALTRATLQLNGGNYRIGGRRLDADANQNLTSTTPTALGSHIFCGIFDYANAQGNFSIDGTLETPQAFQTAGNTSDTDSIGLGIAANSSEQNFFNGAVAEAIVIEGDISSETRQQIEGYLAWKWGLTANLPEDHPFKYRPPTESSLATEDWDPTAISTYMWFDAADEGTIAHAAGVVSQWNDKSGNARHATQTGSTSLRPTTGTRKINNKNAMNFDPTEYLNLPSFDFMGKECYAVFEMDALDDFEVLGASGNVQVSAWTQNGVVNPPQLRLWAGSIYSGDTKSVTTLPLNQPHLAGWLAHNPKQFVVNGTWESTGETPTGSACTVNAILRNQFNDGQDGIVGEIIVVDGTSTIENRQKIEGYLAHKWGLTANLPSGHPYKTKKPQKTKLWTPNDIATNAWYDAADPGTIIDTTDPGFAEQWSDKSGNDRHLVQTNLSKKPATGTRKIGALNALDFDNAVSSGMRVDTGVSIGDYHELYFVIDKDGLDSTRTLFHIAEIGQAWYMDDYAYGGYGYRGTVNPSGGGAQFGTIREQIDQVMLGYNGVGYYKYVNGEQVGVTSNTPGTLPVNRISIGMNGFSGNSFDGLIGEVVIVPPQTTEGRQLIEGYLAWKWGFPHQLPDTHPYKRRPPMI